MGSQSRFRFQVQQRNIMSRTTLHLAVFALVCHMIIEHGWARTAHDCFFVDGKALCGEEGQLAREQQRLSIEAKLRERQFKADQGELPQGDDPRFESRVAFTGSADTNENGNARPEKGQARPLPTPCPLEETTTTTTTTTTTLPPCPVTTTTTTTLPPCPLTTTTEAATTTTEAPLSPCERARQEALLRNNNNPYVMMADQPIAEAVFMDQDRGQIINQERPAFTQLTTDTQDAPILSDSMMGSRMPDTVRGTRGLSLYRTFMEPERSFGLGQTSHQGQVSNIGNAYDDQDFEYY